jgi:hypothetical protein
MVFLQVLDQAGVMPELKGEIRQRVFAPLGEIFARAQQSGQVRADLDPSELPLLIGMVSATAKHHDGKGQAAQGWERYLTLLTDALRTPSPSPLPG